MGVIVKKGALFSLMVVALFLASSCDVYNTLYVKPQQEAQTPTPDKITADVINEISEQTPVIPAVQEDPFEEKDELPKDTPVIISQETELVSLVPKAEDPDKDALIFTFTSPFDENGEWQTKYGDAGEYTITITASDGISTATKEVLVIVNKREEPPVFKNIKPAETAVSLDETKAMKFEADASDLNNDALSYIWKLDGVETNTGNSYNYQTTYEDAGSHTIKASV